LQQRFRRCGSPALIRRDQVDLERGLVHVRRLKSGTPSVHPMGGSENRALRRLKREQIESRRVFVSERRAPTTAAGFRKMVPRTGESGNFPFSAHARMLRPACGCKLANDGQHTRPLQIVLGRLMTERHSLRCGDLVATGGEADIARTP
jgi:type 1 fimbriae regulatory protein FimB/type 1 fimbriae regulatory protein FimE